MTNTPDGLEPDDLDPEAGTDNGLNSENPPTDLLELHEVLEWQAAIDAQEHDR